MRARSQSILAILAAIGATTMLVMTGCSGGDSNENRPGDGSTSATEMPFEPKIEVTEGSETFEITDEVGSVITFNVAYPVAEVTGVKPEVAEAFQAEVAEQKDQVFESAQAYNRLTITECQGTCERDATSTVVHVGVYEEYGTVATESEYMFGTRDRNPGVHSVTMNLKTGKPAELSDFIDLADTQVQSLAAAALQKTENWAYCAEPVADYLATAGAFSPTDEGMLLLWPINGTNTAQCGVDRVTVPWPDPNAPEEAPADEPAAEPAAEDINGRWCPTPESQSSDGCVSIALPNVTYENSGTVAELTHTGIEFGGFQFIVPDAPFGGYYPAGVAIEMPSYYAGVDLPDQDRIWNGQTGTLMLRQ